MGYTTRDVLDSTARDLARAVAALVDNARGRGPGAGIPVADLVHSITALQVRLVGVLAEAGEANDEHFAAGGKVDRAPVPIGGFLRAYSALGAAAAHLGGIAIHGIDQMNRRIAALEEKVADDVRQNIEARIVALEEKGRSLEELALSAARRTVL